MLTGVKSRGKLHNTVIVYLFVQRCIIIVMNDYAAAIQTWTVRDVRKRSTALQSGICYFVFWDNDLSDFHMWLNEYLQSSSV